MFRMLKIVFFSLALLTAGKAFPQEKGLIRYDEKAFEKATKGIDPDDYINKQRYALEVFRVYSQSKDVLVSFTEEDYEYIKKMVLSIDKEKDGLQLQINELQKQLVAKDGNDIRLRRKQHEIDSLNKQIKELEKHTIDFEKRCHDLSVQLQGMKRELDKKNEQISELRAALNSAPNNPETNEDNQSKNNNKPDNSQKYQKAVEEAKTFIYSIYNSNLVKPIVEMDPVQLEQASSKFDGLRSLLAVDEKMFEELQSRVDEIKAWRALINPLKEAKQYLKGKYDDSKQKEYVAAIGSVTIKGSKTAEKEETLQYLNDEASLYKNYCTIIRNLEDFGCLPTNETLWEANEMLAFMTSNKPFYHSAVYDSYDRGISILRAELGKPSPSDKVKTASEFNKFIKEIKEIF